MKRLLFCLFMISNTVFGQYSITDSKGITIPETDLPTIGTTPWAIYLAENYSDPGVGMGPAIWADVSGNKRHLIQTTDANKPTATGSLVVFSYGNKLELDAASGSITFPYDFVIGFTKLATTTDLSEGNEEYYLTWSAGWNYAYGGLKTNYGGGGYESGVYHGSSPFIHTANLPQDVDIHVSHKTMNLGEIELYTSINSPRVKYSYGVYNGPSPMTNMRIGDGCQLSQRLKYIILYNRNLNGGERGIISDWANRKYNRSVNYR